MNPKHIRVSILLIAAVLSAGSVLAQSLPSQKDGNLAGTTVFIHLTANFKENDGPVCVAFNAAWRAILDGAKVEILFDQDAAYGVKQWEPGKTDLGAYPLPDRIKDLLAESFAVDREALPNDYQQFLAMLHDQGAQVLVNGFWNALTDVEKTIKGREHILPFVEPLSLAEILALRSRADIYLRF